MITAKLEVMGNIDVLEDGSPVNFPMALVLSFDNAEDIRQALKDMEVKFEWKD